MGTMEGRSVVGDYGAGRALTDEQYARIAPALPPAKRGGRPRATELRRVLDALFYLARTGCQWRHLPPPPRFPPWQTVYGYLRSFIDAGVWERLHHHLLMAVREAEGREASPSVGSMDSPSRSGPRKRGAARR